MAGFDKDAFWLKILSLYNEAKENNYVLKLDEERVRELKSLYIDLYIPIEEIGHYDDDKLMKKLMTAIVSIYKLDKDTMGNGGEIVQLVNTVNYDGRNMYIRFARYPCEDAASGAGQDETAGGRAHGLQCGGSQKLRGFFL